MMQWTTMRRLASGLTVGTVLVAGASTALTAQEMGGPMSPPQPASSPKLALMPLPSSLSRGSGFLVVTPAGGQLSSFTYAFAGKHDTLLEAATHRAMVRLSRTCGGDLLKYQAEHPATAGATLTLQVASESPAVQPLNEDESYSLTVTPQTATLKAPTDLGALHGLQTLLQLATDEGGACVLPAVTIEDTPRFPWRGLMLDVSRHFETISAIERNLDAMETAKLNVFHWHLSDDQSFRAESKKFPKLTSVGTDGQFYTQDEMRAVVAYACARGIRVVPEFDMPGHATSWVLAYPELSPDQTVTQLPIVYGIHTAALDPTRESTYKFVNTLVEEMGSIFPDQYFHIGGDEVDGKPWLQDPRIAAFMKKKGFTKADELQAMFNQRLEVILKKHGKTMVGWDEILNPALPKSIVIQSWRGETSLAAGAVQGFQGILSAPYYLDGQKSSAQMFLADPIPSTTQLTPDQQKLILGGEVCMWAEQTNSETRDSRVWPRTLPIAERFWSPQADRDVSDMYRRLRINSLKLEDVGMRQISGPEIMRRSLMGERDPAALDVLASVLEPVSFGERYHVQHTNGYTALDRLVDAVVADPPSRQQITGEVLALTGGANATVADKEPVMTDPRKRVDASGDVPQGTPPPPEVASRELRQRFLSWQNAVPSLLDAVHATPRLSDAQVRVEQLGELAQVGLTSLTYLEAHTAPPAGWQKRQMAIIDSASEPAALVRFTFLRALRQLVAAAPQAQPATTPTTH